MAHFCKGCMRSVQQSVCEYCGWSEASSNGDNALPAGLVIGNRYMIGGLVGKWVKKPYSREKWFREGRRFNSYSKLYYAWDKARNQRVEIEEFYPSGSSRTGEVKRVVFGNHECYDGSSLYQSLPLFMKMGNSPSRWCGIKGVERIYDFFGANGTWFIVREAVDAVCLYDWIWNSRQPSMAPTLDESIDILVQLVAILLKFKKMGLSHGGIDPLNLYVKENNEILLRDFENLGFQLDIINDWIRYDDVPVTELYSPYYPDFRSLSNKPSWQSQYRDIYAICCVFYSCATFDYAKHSGVDVERIGGLSNRQRAALAKGLCAEDKVWYHDVAQFKNDFFG